MNKNVTYRLGGRAPAMTSSDHVTTAGTPVSNGSTVQGDFVDLLNGTMTVPTDDTAWSGTPYTVSSQGLIYYTISSGFYPAPNLESKSGAISPLFGLKFLPTFKLNFPLPCGVSFPI